MALTAEEWLALPIEEGDRRADELSPHEAFRLRTELSYWPRGPEHYPNGPIVRKKKKWTEEEKRKYREKDFHVFRDLFHTIPENITFEQWDAAGNPLHWDENGPGAPFPYVDDTD